MLGKKDILDRFEPTWMVESVYQITPHHLKELDISTVLVDLDNTLIAWDNPSGTAETVQWIEKLKKEDICIVIISNNSKKRVRVVADMLDVDFISNAMKPLTRGFNKALEHFGRSDGKTIVVGDQVMTDIHGANRVGLESVLVKPLVTSDSIVTLFNRKIEKKLLKYITQINPDMKWRDSLDDTGKQ